MAFAQAASLATSGAQRRQGDLSQGSDTPLLAGTGKPWLPGRFLPGCGQATTRGSGRKGPPSLSATKPFASTGFPFSIDTMR